MANSRSKILSSTTICKQLDSGMFVCALVDRYGSERLFKTRSLAEAAAARLLSRGVPAQVAGAISRMDPMDGGGIWLKPLGLNSLFTVRWRVRYPHHHTR